ncbi:peptidylprolyl isomerase [Pseudoroseomonas globiformis]|uniref:Parvulin-like PPIase n=1 Tax=Teichococcus globiformis TaxID=2307229 RepID=A0ABV7FXD5_9PROT
MHLTRLILPALVLPVLLQAGSALSQAPQAPAAQAQPPAASDAPVAPSPDTVVARVNGEVIRLADVQEAVQLLPQELRGAPGPMLFPLVVDQLVAQKAIASAARAEKLDQEPEVKEAMRRAADEQLQQALLRRAVAPSLTDEALRRRYDAEFAGKAGEEEVHARHILVKTEEDAKKALAEASKKGADFAAVAKKMSTGPGTEQGGDLGFFKRGDMVPEFAEAAFAMKPGEISKTPVQTAFGFHVIKVEERRAAPVPSFEEAMPQLRQAAFEEAVNEAVEKYQASATIERFNMDGSPRTEDAAPAR